MIVLFLTSHLAWYSNKMHSHLPIYRNYIYMVVNINFLLIFLRLFEDLMSIV